MKNLGNEYLQHLEELLKVSEVPVHMDRETYLRRRSRFGSMVDTIVHAAIIFAQSPKAGNPVTEIYVKFAKLNEMGKYTFPGYSLTFLYKEKKQKNGKVRVKAVATIAFTPNSPNKL